MLYEDYRFDAVRLPGLSPVVCGTEQCASGFSVAVPRPYYLLHYVLSGRGNFSTGGKTYTVLPSQIFVVRPHRPHVYTADSIEPWRYLWISFYSDVELPALLESDVFTAPSLRGLFTDTLAVAREKVGAREAVTGKLWTLVSELQRMQATHGMHRNPYVTAAKRYIEENYMKPISVADMAHMLNLDRSYFSTVFRRETGTSPKQYLASVRLERAAQLLAVEGESVAGAAVHSGYGDSMNFSRQFKAHFGVSPSRYSALITAFEKGGTLPQNIE